MRSILNTPPRWMQSLRQSRRRLPIHGHRATSQVVGEAPAFLSPTLPYPSGAPIWKDLARRSALAIAQEASGQCSKDILTDDSIYNAMVVHAAAGIRQTLCCIFQPSPTLQVYDNQRWKIGPVSTDLFPASSTRYQTVPVLCYRASFLAEKPAVMLHLRDLGLPKLDANTVTGKSLGKSRWWEASDRRRILKRKLTDLDGIDPSEVIMPLEKAKSAGSRVPSLSSRNLARLLS